MASRALGLPIALTALMVSLGGCGGGDGETPARAPDPGPSSTDAARPPPSGRPPRPAERLCSEYRQAVTEIRFNGSPADQAKDFRAAARVARAARKKTGANGLGPGGRGYLDALDTLIPAYEDAAAAAAKRDSEAFDRALDAAEPADEALDTFADRAGLERCSLDEPRKGRESRVSQSGFPALIVPKGQRLPPSPNQSSQAYPLGPDEAIVLERGPEIPTGTVPPARAARAFRESDPDFRRLEPIGALGDEQVPVRGYRYEHEKDRGTVAVFSGQGHLWLMVCSSRRPNGPSRMLESACARAAETAGFLMF